MIEPIKNILLAAEPNAALTPRAMDDWMARSVAVREFQTVLMNVFATFATLLAGFGLYSVMSYLTAQRLHEIGVRMALGASAPGIAGLVIRQGLIFAALGMAAGIVLVLVGYRLLASRLYMTGLFDLLTLGASAVLVLLIAAVASWAPALRASRVDPIVVLRGE
jgi:putative ABC transport system permease protein